MTLYSACTLENRREENISVGLSQDKQHKHKQHHGRIHSPGVDWNPKDLGLCKERALCILDTVQVATKKLRTAYMYIQCKLQYIQ